MANRLLLQSIVKFRDQIKDGTAKVFDIVQDYFNKTGKTVTEEERALILSEFAKDAPTNVTPLKSRAFDEVDETAEGFDPDYMRGTSDTDKTAGELLAESEGVDVAETILPTRPFTNLVEQKRGVKLRGDESFGELMEKLGPAGSKKEGLGSLFPKGEPGSIFDQKNTNREEVAEFIRKMRGAGIKNEDIQKVIREETTFDPQPARRGDPNAPKEVVNLGQGKRAATTLARAADMKADTKIKQEFLSELDEKIAEKGPRFFNEEYQGFDSYGALINNEGIRIRNAIYDDLEEMGVDEETIGRIIRAANEVAERRPYEPERFMASIKDDLEINGINYNTDFWDNYISKTLELSTKPEPRFEYGGMV
jgi:DNA-binding transcriptional MerR regulator